MFVLSSSTLALAGAPPAVSKSPAPVGLRHTPRHIACPACLATEEQLMLATSVIAPHAAFAAASEQWLELRSFGTGSGRHRFLKPATLKSYRQYRKALLGFFAALPLEHIGVGHLREYQRQRAESAGPQKVNQELNLLIQILQHARCWGEDQARLYEPFQVDESDIPLALTAEQEERLLATLASAPRFHLTRCYAILGIRTALSPVEQRCLRLCDLPLEQGVLTVRSSSAKRKKRVRTIPFMDDAAWAAAELIAMAKRRGSHLPHHHLFPFRVAPGVFDPERPMSSWGLRKPWEEARELAGLPKLRLEDLRHTGMTRWAEAGVEITYILDWGGHVSDKLRRHYTHIGREAARGRMAEVYRKKPPRSEGRNYSENNA